MEYRWLKNNFFFSLLFLFILRKMGVFTRCWGFTFSTLYVEQAGSLPIWSSSDSDGASCCLGFSCCACSHHHSRTNHKRSVIKQVSLFLSLLNRNNCRLGQHKKSILVEVKMGIANDRVVPVKAVVLAQLQLLSFQIDLVCWESCSVG